jgi:uncharacterized phage protein (TIGR01671 family)
MIPKFRFFGRVADGEMRMVMAEAIDFKGGFVYYSYHDYTVEGDDNVYGDTISFENCVLMQSTGLLDKNGDDIFEGDVVEVFDSRYTVFYDSENASFRLKPRDKRWNTDYMSNYAHEASFEIIGNIYEGENDDNKRII